MAKGLLSRLIGKVSGAASGAVSGGANDAEPPKITPVMSEGLRAAISRLKGQKPGPDMTPASVLAQMFPISAEIAREEAARDAVQKRAAQEALKNPQPGQLIAGRGVFLGVWAPKDRSGNSLNKTFNIFAAPYDLGLDENGQGTKLVTTYNKAVAAVGKIKSLMGFAGFKGKNDTDLYNALRDGSYKGEWFIPTRDILHGKDKDGTAVQPAHLYGLKDTDAFRDTFTTASDSGSAHWYWSGTEHPDNASYVYDVRFSDGVGGWLGKDFHSLSCRPVRAELRP